jgi:hypothetical protein
VSDRSLGLAMFGLAFLCMALIVGFAGYALFNSLLGFVSLYYGY